MIFTLGYLIFIRKLKWYFYKGVDIVKTDEDEDDDTRFEVSRDNLITFLGHC